MSAPSPAVRVAWGRRPSLRTAAGVALIVGGVASLALRPAMLLGPDLSANARSGLLALLYVSLTTACVLPPSPRDPAPLPSAVVLAAGTVALTVAWWTAGPTAPLAVASTSIALSTAAAVAEEALFRRLAYDRLRRFGVPVAIGVTAVLFAVVHVPAYGVAVLPVDLGAGLLFGWQRWACGTWTVPAATHAAANLLAVMP